MKATVDKCKTCGVLFEDEAKYEKHIEKHNIIAVINGGFPKVIDENCKFANGHWNVQRSKEWLNQYKESVENVVVNDYEPWSYGWFRCLDDSGDMLYPIACRALNICLLCFREWGQAYHANHCNHEDKNL